MKQQLAVLSFSFSFSLALGLAGSVAHAEEKQAEALFKKGKKLLAEKRYADACAAFEKSNSLDPNIGAKLNVAKCFEEWGKLATALRWYRDAEKTARDTKDPRADKIHEVVEAVDSDTPRLTLRTAKDADTGVGVTLDGAPAKLDEPLEVDPGAHVVEYTASNGDKKKKVIPVERGSSSEVKLDLPRLKPGQKPTLPPKETPAGPTPVEPGPEDPGRTRRLIGIVTGSAGIVAVGIASYLTLDARGSYKDALAAHCAGSSSMCDPVGLQVTHDARSQANLATVVGLVGVATIAGGVVLYLTAPKADAGGEARAESKDEAWYLAPAISGDGGGLVFGGRY